MDIRIVNNQFAVAPQIMPLDIAEIKANGYVAIINNRPDGESDEQPTNEKICQQAIEAGLAYYHLPILSGTLPPEAIEETKKLLTEINGPCLAFCRSGTRSITLWALAQAGEQNKEEIITAVKGAGYDLPFLANFL